jgi:peptidoglycan/xylan/chitin deacetylase (PgdA/CDA1 family)
LDLEKKIKNYPYQTNRCVLKRMFKLGHDIGSHTFDHSVLTNLTDQQVLQQMDETSDLFKEVIGVRPAFMRAPEGY